MNKIIFNKSSVGFLNQWNYFPAKEKIKLK